jgi:hypothetical protein
VNQRFNVSQSNSHAAASQWVSHVPSIANGDSTANNILNIHLNVKKAILPFGLWWDC